MNFWKVVDINFPNHKYNYEVIYRTSTFSHKWDNIESLWKLLLWKIVSRHVMALSRRPLKTIEHMMVSSSQLVTHQQSKWMLSLWIDPRINRFHIKNVTSKLLGWNRMILIFKFSQFVILHMHLKFVPLVTILLTYKGLVCSETWRS